MRLFVALGLPPACRTACAALLDRLRGPGGRLRLASADRLHATLAFLGEVDGARVGAITAALDAVGAAHGPVRFGARGVGAFPDLRRPRVLWIGGADPDGTVARLAAAVQAALAPLGFVPEDRPFRAHLTIARPKDPRLPRPLLDALAAACDFDGGVGAVDRLVLMESRLGPAGSTYMPAAEIPLRGPA